MAGTLPDALGNLYQISDFTFEIIVINDGSTDSTKEVIRHFKNETDNHKNISFKSIEIQNCGRAEALNRGAELAAGMYISFMDADDLIDPKELVKLWSCASANPTDLILGQFKIVNETGKLLATRSLPHYTVKTSLIKRIAFSPVSPLHLNAFLINRKYFFKIGKFDKTNLKSEDKDFILRLLRGSGTFQVCDTYHYLYRKHDLTRKKLITKRFEWMFYRQQMINKNFKGLTKAGSTFVQLFYDLVKLSYEVLFKYRI